MNRSSEPQKMSLKQRIAAAVQATYFYFYTEWCLFANDAALTWTLFRQSRLELTVKLLIAVRRTMLPHGNNNRFRKLMSLVIFLVWSAAFLGDVFGLAEASRNTAFVVFTAFVFALLGSVLGIEWREIGNVQVSFTDGGENGD